MSAVRTYLIIDAGATKTNFVLAEFGPEMRILGDTRGAGINANYSDNDEIMRILSDAVSTFPRGIRIDSIEYYGAGCATPAGAAKIDSILRLFFPTSRISVSSDLLAACRSLAGNSRAIVCILGTGAASCLFDGREIVGRAPSLGFMLGDEGSGTNLGKRLLQHYLSGRLPSEIKSKFEANYNLNAEIVIKKLYQEEHPNRFMASLAPFLKENEKNETIHNILTSAFSDFFISQKGYYQDSNTTVWHFTGSVAENFKSRLIEASKAENCHIGRIEADPMPSLIDFHLKNSHQ